MHYNELNKLSRDVYIINHTLEGEGRLVEKRGKIKSKLKANIYKKIMSTKKR